jgi:hypothetical protein
MLGDQYTDTVHVTRLKSDATACLLRDGRKERNEQVWHLPSNVLISMNRNVDTLFRRYLARDKSFRHNVEEKIYHEKNCVEVLKCLIKPGIAERIATF